MDNNDNSSDPNIQIWKRFKEASTAEKEWIHERLSWLFTPQTILFSAYILVFNEKIKLTALTEILKIIIPLIGIGTSSVVLTGTIAAGVMHWKWTTRMNQLAEKINGDENNKKCGEIIVPFGTPPYWPARTSSILPCIIPFVFIISWIFVLLR